MIQNKMGGVSGILLWNQCPGGHLNGGGPSPRGTLKSLNDGLPMVGLPHGISLVHAPQN